MNQTQCHHQFLIFCQDFFLDKILKYYSNVSFDCCYNNNDNFCAIRLHKQTGHVFKRSTDVTLEAQRTQPDCQLCERRVGERREREWAAERRCVGVNVTEQSLVIPPRYSDLFVILPQMFSWSRDGATHSRHCWLVGWWGWRHGGERARNQRARTSLCWRAAAALLKRRSTERFGTLWRQLVAASSAGGVA